MRRAMRVLIPAALLCLSGVGYLAYEDKLNLLRVDLSSLLGWGDTTARDATPVVSKAPSAEPATIASIGAPDATATSTSRERAGLSAQSPRLTGTSRNGLKIDFARVDGNGVSVLGGQAPAGSRISVRANGEVVATVTASDDGQWSAIITRAFPAGPLGLSITSDAAQGASTEGPTVTIEVPKGGGPVALAEVEAAKARPILPPRPAEAESQAINKFAAMVERARSSSTQDGGAKPEAAIVPVPITFVTGEATMTTNGIRAAQLLTEYVKLVKPRTITLSGHADVRGGEDYNLDLSRRRLETIRSFLRENGYVGEFALQAKGKTEPYQGIDRRTAAIHEVYQADRRVELRLAE